MRGRLAALSQAVRSRGVDRLCERLVQSLRLPSRLYVAGTRAEAENPGRETPYLSGSEVIKLNRDSWVRKVTYIAQIPGHQAPLQIPGHSLINGDLCRSGGGMYVQR